MTVFNTRMFFSWDIRMKEWVILVPISLKRYLWQHNSMITHQLYLICLILYLSYLTQQLYHYTVYYFSGPRFSFRSSEAPLHQPPFSPNSVCLPAGSTVTDMCPGKVSHSSCRMNVIINSYHWGTFVSWTDTMWQGSLNSSLVACHNWSLSCSGGEKSVWWDLLDTWRWIHFIEFISSMVRCHPSFVARGLHSSAWPCVPLLFPLFIFHTLTSPFSAPFTTFAPLKSLSRCIETPAELPLGGWGGGCWKSFAGTLSCSNTITYSDGAWVSLPYPLASFGFQRH